MEEIFTTYEKILIHLIPKSYRTIKKHKCLVEIQTKGMKYFLKE